MYSNRPSTMLISSAKMFWRFVVKRSFMVTETELGDSTSIASGQMFLTKSANFDTESSRRPRRVSSMRKVTTFRSFLSFDDG